MGKTGKIRGGKSLSGKTQGISKFCQSTGNLEILPKHREFGNFVKTQGTWKFCQNTGNLEILPKHKEFGNFTKTGNLEILLKQKKFGLLKS